MPDHFVSIVFAVLSVVYLTLYGHDFTLRKDKTRPAKKAWLRVGVIFAVVSMALYFLRV